MEDSGVRTASSTAASVPYADCRDAALRRATHADPSAVVGCPIPPSECRVQGTTRTLYACVRDNSAAAYGYIAGVDRLKRA